MAAEVAPLQWLLDAECVLGCFLALESVSNKSEAVYASFLSDSAIRTLVENRSGKKRVILAKTPSHSPSLWEIRMGTWRWACSLFCTAQPSAKEVTYSQGVEQELWRRPIVCWLVHWLTPRLLSDTVQDHLPKEWCCPQCPGSYNII